MAHSPRYESMKRVIRFNAIKLLAFLSEKRFPIRHDHKELLENCSRFNINDFLFYSKNKSSKVISATFHQTDDDVLDIAKVYVNIEVKWKWTPLHWSAFTGESELVDILIKAGTNVNAESDFLMTALHLSVLKGHIPIVKLLLKARANVEAVNKFQETPLHLIASNKHSEIVKLLFFAGANIDAKDINEQTALHKNAFNGHTDIVNILVQAEANIHVKNGAGRSPLHESVYNRHKDIVRILIDAGADVNAVDDNKRTPLHESAYNGDKEIVIILLEAGAKLNVLNNYNQTPLHLSVRYKHDDITELFLQTEASFRKIRDIEGNSAIDYMNASQKERFGFLLENLTSIFGRFNSKRINDNSAQKCVSATETEFKQTEIINSTKTFFERYGIKYEYHYTNEDNTLSSTSDETSPNTSTTSFDKDQTKYLSPGLKKTWSSTSEAHAIPDEDRQEMESLKKHVDVNWDMSSLQQIEGWETCKSSNDVKAGIHNGPTTINYTKNIINIEKIKHVNTIENRGLEANYSIEQADNVAGTIAVLTGNNCYIKGDDVGYSDDEEGSVQN